MPESPSPPTQGELTVDRQFKDGKILRKEESTTEQIEVQALASNTRVAQVHVGGRMTLNLGNYESAQLSVAVTLPCYVEELEEAYVAAKEFVDLRLNSEMNDLRDMRDAKSSSGSEAF